MDAGDGFRAGIMMMGVSIPMPGTSGQLSSSFSLQYQDAQGNRPARAARPLPNHAGGPETAPPRRAVSPLRSRQ